MAFGLLVRLEAETAQFHARMAAAEAQLNRMSRSPVAAARGMGMMQSGMRALSVQAIGLTGPLGTVAAGLGMFAVGGPLMLAVTAGLGAGALAAKLMGKSVEDLARYASQNFQKVHQKIAEMADIGASRLENLRNAISTVNQDIANLETTFPQFPLATFPKGAVPLTDEGFKREAELLREKLGLQHQIAIEYARQREAIEAVTGIAEDSIIDLLAREREFGAVISDTNRSLDDRTRALERLAVVRNRLARLYPRGEFEVPEIRLPALPPLRDPREVQMEGWQRAELLRRPLPGTGDLNRQMFEMIRSMFPGEPPDPDAYLKLSQAMKLAGIGAGEMEAAVLTGFGAMVEGVISQTGRLEVLVVAGFFRMAESILAAERALAIQRATLAASAAVAGGASAASAAAAGAVAGGALAGPVGAIAIAGVAILGGIVSGLLGRSRAAPVPVRVTNTKEIAQATQVPPQPIYIFRGENVEQATVAIRGQDRRDRSERIPRGERPWLWDRR